MMEWLADMGAAFPAAEVRPAETLHPINLQNLRP